MTPSVSVNMPVYNVEPYVRESIESVLSQSFEDFELIIVDDGSTDGSLDVVRSFNDKRIKIIQNEKNMGLVYTRNKLVRESCGEFIAVLDSDDIATVDRLKIQYEFLKENPKYAVVGGWLKTIRSNGAHFGNVWRYITDPDQLPVRLLFGNQIAHSAVMMRRNILDESPYKAEFPVGQDYDLWVRLSQKHKIINLPELFYYYRQHQNSVTKSKKSVQDDSTYKILKYQLYKFGISPSENELEFHRKIGKTNLVKSYDDLTKIEAWFKKLIEANRKKSVYPTNIFNKVIFELWHDTCLYSRYSGKRAVRRLFFESEILKNTPIVFKARAKFFIKSLPYM